MLLDMNQYRLIVENAPNLLWRSGTDGLCNYFNTTWLEFTGRSMEQEVGNGWADGVHPEDFDMCLKIYTESFARRVSFEMLYRLRRADGEWRWIDDRGVPFYNDDGVFQGYIGSCIDVDDKVKGESWKTFAQKDGLTGINSRRFFEELAGHEFEKARRYHTPLSAMMIDIDGFKSINDHFGHQAGDQVLAAFARFLQEHIREFDILGRYGGDEFILVLPDTDRDGAETLASRLTALCDKPMTVDETIILQIRFSWGISSMQDHSTLSDLIAEADQEMYLQKGHKKALP